MAAAPLPRPTLRLFFSYAREDEALRDRLEVHLRALERAGLLTLWHDRDIRAGENWRERIAQAVEQADVILLLISPDFVSSDYCYTVEMGAALRRHAATSALVIPVLLRPVVVADGQPWMELQALPRDLRPAVLWPDLDEVLALVARGVLEALESWSAVRPAAPPLAPVADEMFAEERVLDAAVPSRVQVGQASEVVALVRRMESGGLRAILASDESFAASPEAVRSQSVDLEFPRDERGRLLPLRLTLVLDAPDFEPPRQTKQIQVPPWDDSPIYVFLAAPRRAGPLALQVELLAGEVSVVTHLLRSLAEPAAIPEPRYVFATLPLSTTSLLGATTTTRHAPPPPGISADSGPPTRARPAAPVAAAPRVQPAPAPQPAVPAPAQVPVPVPVPVPEVDYSADLEPSPATLRANQTKASPAPYVDSGTYPAAREPAMARLVLIREDGTEEAFPLARDSSTLGRHGQNDIVLLDPKVSAFHARLDRSPEGFVLVDLKSRNGCWVNGQKVERALLKTGDELRLGLTRLVFKLDLRR